MGFRFRKSFKLAPGIKVNVSHKGVSTRIGPKAAGISTGPSGTRVSANVPGSGISYSKKIKAPLVQSEKLKQAPRQQNERSVATFLITATIFVAVVCFIIL